jgi:Cyclopropane fatty acid synthase and related methyltransferases
LTLRNARLTFLRQCRPRNVSPYAVRLLRERVTGAGAPVFDLVVPSGTVHRIGAAPAVPAFTLRLTNDRGWRALGSLDETRIAEAYLHGDIDFDGDMLAALDLRRFLSDRHPLASLWRFVQPWLYGEVGADKTWVPQHYDYGNEFYFSFLDRKFRLYSQAIYTVDDETLEQAAQNKLDYVMDICRLGPGRRVLDVGGGWGSFAGYAASRGTDVTMLTISREQFAYLSEWCATHTPARPAERDLREHLRLCAGRAVRRHRALWGHGAPAQLSRPLPQVRRASRAGRTRVYGLRGGEEEV